MSHRSALIALTTLGALVASGAQAATFTVNSTSVRVDADTGDGVCDTGSTIGGVAECTLHAAIQQANATAGQDLIAFDITGAGPHRIQPPDVGSRLPAITEAVTIDGYTQPGAGVNTLDVGNDAVILIELDGSLAGNVFGIAIQGSDCVVRGLSVHGFASRAFQVTGDRTVIEGNWIGVDPSGTLNLGNEIGIQIASADDVRIGGAVPSQRNVISGSDTRFGTRSIAIDVQGPATGVRILGNYIGADPSGTTGFGNSSGIRMINIDGLIIGGLGPGEGNLIADSVRGVEFWRDTSGTQVLGNVIGTSPDGSVALGNDYGIEIFAGSFGQDVTDARIEGNSIVHSRLYGVVVGSASGFSGDSLRNRIVSNSIHDSGTLGIDLQQDLGSGPTPNDPGDADDGPNLFQNFPVLATVLADAAGTDVTGTLDGPPGDYLLQFFSNPICHASGHGEGKTFLGEANVTIDATGAFAVDRLAPAPGGETFYTATATDATGNTSEFSACFALGAISDSEGDPNDLLIDFGNVFVNQSRSETVTVANNGSGDAQVGGIAATDPLAAPFAIQNDSCSNVTLAPGALCTFEVRFGPTAEIPLTVDTFDIPIDQSSTTFTVQGRSTLGPVLVLAKTGSVVQPHPAGPQVSFRLTVTNTGSGDASGVVVTDGFPFNELTYSGDDSGGSYDPGTGDWTVGDLAAGAGATLNISADMRQGFAGGAVTNSAWVSACSECDPATLNVPVSAVVGVGGTDLSVTVVDDEPPGGVNVSGNEVDNVTYTVTVTNVPLSRNPTDVMLSFSMTHGAIRSIDPAEPSTTCTTPTNRSILCDIGFMGAETRTVTIVVSPPPGETMSVTARAFSSTYDPIEGNDTGTEDTVTEEGSGGTNIANFICAILYGNDVEEYSSCLRGASRPCFIATAAYGSYLEPEVETLRDFRDAHLLTNAPGRVFVAWYYRSSPPLAAFIAKHQKLRSATRLALTPLVFTVAHPWMAGGLVLVGGAGLIVGWRRRRRKRARLDRNGGVS